MGMNTHKIKEAYDMLHGFTLTVIKLLEFGNCIPQG